CGHAGALDAQQGSRGVPPSVDRGTQAEVGRKMTQSEPEHVVVIAPDLAPAVGYAHAVAAAPGHVVYLGGQTAQTQAGSVAAETMVEQFELAARNLNAALRAAGGRPDH